MHRSYAALLLFFAANCLADEIRFEKLILTDKYFCDGIAAGDINGDGHKDVVAGPFWYEGPDFTTAHAFYKPVPLPPVDTYSVVAKDVPVRDLLFSLARDADLDPDIQTATESTITINAVEQPLPAILARIATQAALRYELAGSNLIIQDDAPYWFNYRIDYVNVTRRSAGQVRANLVVLDTVAGRQ